MRNKTAIYLGIAFVVLLIIFIVSRVSDKSVERVRYLVEVDTSKVDYIHTISPTNGAITLEKVNQIWRVTEPVDYPAEQRSVHETLTKLDIMEIENLVTSRPDRFAEYQVDDSAGVSVEIKAGGKKTAGFVMGKPSSTYRHTYFRKEGSNDVYMIEGSFKYFFDRSLKDWRNKVILDINKDSIEECKLIYPDQTITLALDDTTWITKTAEEEFVADKPKVDQMLNYASRLRAADFHDVDEGETPPDFTNPIYQLEITFSGGHKQSISLLPEAEDENKFMVKKMDDETIYQVYKGTADILMKDLDSFKPQAEQKEKEKKKG